MTARLPPAVMKANIDAAMDRALAAAKADPQPQADEPGAFRKAAMTQLRVKTNQLRAIMLDVARNDVEVTMVFGAVVRNERGWDQLLADLDALAGLARMEE